MEMTTPDLSIVLPFPNAEGKDCLAVLGKRTYAFAPGHGCIVAPEQRGIDYEPEYHDAKGQGGDSPPRADPDTICHLKAGTDVVIQGSAHSVAGPVPSMEVGVGIAPPGEGSARYGSRLHVYGDRRLVDRGRGHLPSFSEPAPFVSMPLTYDRAFGGRDIWSERLHPDEMSKFMGRVSGSPELTSRYVYPRNPAGRGYLVHPSAEAFSELELPNIEFPWDLLTPDRLCVGHIEDWPKAPVPGGFDWIEQSWFPRIAFLGLYATHRCPPDAIHEFRTGYLPAELFDVPLEALPGPSAQGNTVIDRHYTRFLHGASPGLALPPMSGRETLLLIGMHPRHEIVHIPLPAERPQMLLEPPGSRPVELRPALRTVVVLADEGLLTMSWVGIHILDRPLPDNLDKPIRHAVRWQAA